MTVSFVFLLVILQNEWQGNIMFGVDILGDNCRCRPPPNANQHTTSISGAQYSTTQPSTPPHLTPAPIIDPRQLKKRHSTGSETCGYRTDAQCKTCSNVPPLQLTSHRKVRPFACGSGLTYTTSNNVRACCTDCDHFDICDRVPGPTPTRSAPGPGRPGHSGVLVPWAVV